MVNIPIHSSVWIPLILLLVDSVIVTKNYDIISDIDHHYNHYYNQYCGQLKNHNYFHLNYTHVLQDLSIFLNDAYAPNSISIIRLLEVTDNGNESKYTIKSLEGSQIFFKSKLEYISIYSTNALIFDFLLHSTNYYYANVYRTEKRSVPNHTLPEIIEKRNHVSEPWKRRTLCAISGDKKHLTEAPFQNDNSEGNKISLDYDGLIPVNDIEDSDSLKTLVRVKRSKPESGEFSSVRYQRDYLKDLSNSFPQNSYDSIDENLYDDDVSSDTKREIRSQEFPVNDDRTIDRKIHEDDRSKIIDDHPLLEGNIKSEDQTKGEVLSKVSSGLSLNDYFVNRRSQDADPEVLDLPADPLLAVELVRKKRNGFAKVGNKNDLERKASLSQNQLTDPKGNDENLIGIDSKSGKQSVVELKRPEKRSSKIPSSLAIADFKAKLLRLRRRAKKDHREGRSKKKQKQAGKKRKTGSNNSKVVRSRKIDRSRAVRERKNDEPKGEGKSKLAIANVVSNKNSDNNFHRRSAVKLRKSIKRADSGRDRFPKRDAKSTKIKNKIDVGNVESSFVKFAAGSDVTDSKAGPGDKMDASLMGKKIENYISAIGETKLRAKRNENTETKHGFVDEEDELRYYKNIQEPGSEMDECIDRDEKVFLEGKVAEGIRAVRSIEEVKELAKKLITKVNELQNYLNVDDVKRNERGVEKRIQTRAIDDLCSNVSTACAVFKESPKLVQKCVPSSQHEFAPTAKILERKSDPFKRRADEQKHVTAKQEHLTDKKRAIVKASPRTARQENEKPNRKWGRWTDWSSCSVTCGKGRQIRWRYCLHDCSTAESEMEEKTCQRPACPPRKFLGIF